MLNEMMSGSSVVIHVQVTCCASSQLIMTSEGLVSPISTNQTYTQNIRLDNKSNQKGCCAISWVGVIPNLNAKIKKWIM